MPLVDTELSINGSDSPSDVRGFLREAYLRVGQCVRNNPIRVNCCQVTTQKLLRRIHLRRFLSISDYIFLGSYRVSQI